MILAIASCVLGLSLVALSLGLSNERTLARRLGRNAAFASGNGIAAGLMGASGYYISNRAVFYIAGALVVPAIVALFCIPAADIAPASDAARAKIPAFRASTPTCSYCCVSRVW